LLYPETSGLIGLMRAYFIRHIAGRVENRLIKLPPRKILQTEVQILRGGLFIPDNSVIYCTNRGNFAPVSRTDKKLGTQPVYKLDLGFEKLEIVMIPDGIETYFVDLKTWQRHKQRTLDKIEDINEDKSYDNFLPPTANSAKIIELIREEILTYLVK
jgi:hypothetical protein